jgi:HSP20 family molecular chaperone IbpA
VKNAAEEKAELTLKRVEEDLVEAGKHVKELQDSAASITKEEAATMDPLMTKQVLDKLHRRVLSQNEALMRDLLLLDALDEVKDEKVKEKRREQARAVQRVMDTLDALAANVAEVKSIAQQRVEEMEKERQEIEQAAAKEKAEKAEKEKKEKEEKEKERILAAITKNLKEILHRFNQLQFEPTFESVEEKDKYVITANIASMKSSDIELSLGRKNTLLVKGKRLPSANDIYEMVVALEERGYQPTIDNLLRLANGKYGVWSESFRCPTDVNVDAIAAKYEENILTIILPKIASMQRNPSQRMQEHVKSPTHHHRSLYNDPFQQLFGNPYGAAGPRLF